MRKDPIVKATTVLLWLTLATVAATPSAAPTPEAPVIGSTGAFFALSVADVNASATWYSETLGLKVVMQPPKQDGAAVIVLEGGGLIVELIQHDDAVPLSKAAPGVKSHILVHG